MLHKEVVIVLYCDIADFYNQINHHALENQLIASKLPNQATKWIISLLTSTTAGVSRGVPVGPHAVHLLAEATLIPVDNSLVSAGTKFLRYADDIVIYCASEDGAREALAKVASILDKQQRLTLQRHKTKILKPADFRALCRKMIEDRPISRDEKTLLEIIAKYSGGNPYATISYGQISEKDWHKITDRVIEGIISEYLAQEPVDYIRLRWFYRRLAQIGHEGAIEISLARFAELGPCLANVCSYLASVQTIGARRWRRVGGQLLKLLSKRQIRDNEFFRLSILSLFSRNEHIDHFPSLAERYGKSDPYARREILLAAKRSGATDWLREHKENYKSMDPWQRSALLYAASAFPNDERKFFINSLPLERPFEITLGKWAKTA